MKRIVIIVVLGLFLGFAPVLHAVPICNPNIPESTPAADFTDHGDGTVTHTRTGLMWKRCAEGQGWIGGACTGTASTATWANALTMGRNATTADYSDWRLPNINELQSIVEEKCYNPSINEAIFPSTPASYFWSASANAFNSNYAWNVYFSDGYASYNYKGGAHQVRLVRAGQSFGSFDSAHGVALSATTLSFAAQNLGTTSAAQSVTLTNNGSAPLNIAGIAASGDYAVAHNCGAGLGAGGFCTLNITFTPTATGTRTGAVTLTDDSIFSTRTIGLTGTGQGAAVSLSATSMTFASQNQGSTSAAQTVTLTNPGGAVLNIASIVASGEFARTTTCGATLAQAASCTISVTFTPTAAGARGGSIVITSNAASSPNTISLSGTGVAVVPVVSLNPTSLTFAAQNVGTSSAAKTIALTNTGGAALTLASITASGDFAVTHNCGATLAQAANCTISVTFTPTAAGTRSGSIVITSNAASSPNTISLNGNGVAVPVVSLNPASLAFAAQTVGTSSAAKTIALTNTGGAALTLASITASGDFAVTHNCGGGLGAGGFCSLSVIFTPTLAGTRTGAITINSNAAGSPHSVGLSNSISRSDCIFNWAEQNFAQYFSPAGATSATYTPYYYRYYSGTGNYLATSSADNNLYALGPATGNSLLNAGPVTDFLGVSGCP